jgi:hypothetical protein
VEGWGRSLLETLETSGEEAGVEGVEGGGFSGGVGD